jgi:hypothetical protein
VGAAPKRRIDTTTNILSKHELGLLEETVQGTIQMIEQIDDGVKRLKTTSCLYYGLGASCPSIERIDRASIVRGNQGTASNRHLPLTSIRRMLADILLVQHNQLLQSSQSLSNKQQPPTISIPAVVTISWIQSARHALVDLLSEFVDGAFCPEKHDILIDQLTRQQLLSNTRANTLANLAYLVGALSWNQPNPPMSANHMSPVKQVIFEIHSRVNTLPVVLYELASMEAVRSLEGTQCCEMAIQLLNELSDLKENLVALTVKEPTKDEPLSVTVNSSEKGTEIRSMDACISSFEYVDGVEELENQLLIPAAPEPRTFVYSGTGAISKPRIENRLPKTEKSTAEPQTVYNIDTAFKSSLVSELKHHLQSIPKIPEVERRTIDKEYKAWLSELTGKVRNAQIKAVLKVNTELLILYWELGAAIVEKQANTKWGDGFLLQLSRDLKVEFPEMQGFSERNLKYIRQWHLFYVATSQTQMDESIRQQVIAQIVQIPGDTILRLSQSVKM